MSTEPDDDDDDEGGGIPPQLIASYVAFAVRAIRKRRLVVLGVFLAFASLGLGLLALWPRTYHCETRLLAQQNQVLAIRGDSGNDALRGASELILRRDNLEAIVKQTELAKTWAARRPFVLKLKDAISAALRGPISEADQATVLVGTLESRLGVMGNNGTLTIAVDWPDAQMSARLVETAEHNFLESRHVAEISTVAEYISILEGHAVRLRTEIETIAEEIQKIRQDKLAEAERNAGRQASAAEASAAARPVIRHAGARTRPPPDENLARMKVVLDAKQRAVSELEEDRSRRLRELNAKLTELSSKYTSAHPAILDVQQNILSLSHESPQVAALRTEVSELEAEVKRRGAVAGAGQEGVSGAAFGGAPAGPAVPGAGPLPSEIMRLMQDNGDGLDPAVGAQLRYSIDKYATLRGEISTARIDLDTAQAAFKHRYKIVLPAEVPDKPTKPRAALLSVVVLFFSLLLALAGAVVAELRSGRIVERWQVHQLALPVLAELRFPPGSED